MGKNNLKSKTDHDDLNINFPTKKADGWANESAVDYEHSFDCFTIKQTTLL